MDANAVYSAVENLKQDYNSRFKEPTRIRLWDGNWSQGVDIQGEYEHDFSFVNLDSGSATVQLPIDNAVAQLMMNPEQWPTKSMYLTFDKDGARWSGRIENCRTEVNYQGDRYVELTAVHDYQKLKELLVWSNPFLPAEVQFPKAWFLFGPSKWAVATTLFVNLLRKNNSLWMLPDDPMDFSQWFDLDMSNWSQVVKPVDFASDNSLTAVVSSRFRYFHDCVKAICEDAQISLECRRYLPGDPDPIPGKNLRYGCLVWDVVDKSGWNKQTSFGGNLLNGLTHVISRVSSDGMQDYIENVPRVIQPAEYSKAGFLGSLPSAPWVVLEHNEFSGIKSTAYEYVPPGPSQFVTGGSSMPGVNEGIKAAVIAVGGVLGSMVGQSQIGAAAEAVLEPLYSDVFMAFMAHKHHDRINKQGWDFPFEYWVDGADKAYTISALSALRKAKWETRERFSCEIEMDNGAPYWVGPKGYGDFFIGDRVAVHALGMSDDKLMVEQVTELKYSSSDSDSGWEIKVGRPEFTSGFSFITKKFEETTAGLKELGVW